MVKIKNLLFWWCNYVWNALCFTHFHWHVLIHMSSIKTHFFLLKNFMQRKCIRCNDSHRYIQGYKELIAVYMVHMDNKWWFYHKLVTQSKQVLGTKECKNSLLWEKGWRLRCWSLCGSLRHKHTMGKINYLIIIHDTQTQVILQLTKLDTLKVPCTHISEANFCTCLSWLMSLCKWGF